MPLVRPPANLLVGTAILLILVGVYFQFAPRALQPEPSVDTTPSPFNYFSRNSTPVPPLVKVTADSDREKYFLGENPLIHLTVENRGRLPIHISAGCDYRGGTRANRFKITVHDIAGHLIADSMPAQVMMGGIGTDRTLKLGETFTISAPLMRYALIENPGTYTIEISHDFGWYPASARPIPTARLSLQFSEPNETQVRTIFAAASVNNGFPSVNSRGKSFGDYTCLRFPRYLPLLQSAAIVGNAKAVIAIGHIRGSLATESLLKLAAGSEFSSDVRRTALEMLADRAPYPAPISHYAPQLVVAPDLLREGAWTDALRADTLRLVRELLTTDTDLTPPSLDLVSAFGTSEDATRILTILDASLAENAPQGGLTQSQSQLLYKSLEALRYLQRLGWSIPANPTRASEIYLTFSLLERGQLPYSAELEELARSNLRHPSLIVRRSAYDTLRQPVPNDLLPAVRSDLQRNTRGLRDAVLAYIRRTQDTRLLPDLIDHLKNNRDRQHQDQLISHALALAGPHKIIPILIHQLNQPSIALENLDQLTQLVMDRRPASFNGVKWQQPNFNALQAAWREFYARYEERIIAGQKFSPEDPHVPTTLFGGRYDWSSSPHR